MIHPNTCAIPHCRPRGFGLSDVPNDTSCCIIVLERHRAIDIVLREYRILYLKSPVETAIRIYMSCVSYLSLSF
jgi:hypothetical protein